MKTQRQMSSMEFFEMFPTEEAAVEWFEKVRWPEGRYCPHCRSKDTYEVASKKPQPYRCREKGCRKYFSATVDTVLASKKLPVRKWLYAMYLMSGSKKGLSSMQLARELRIAPESAWRLGHKIREAWNRGALFPMTGEVEVDGTYIGGRRRNMSNAKRNEPAGTGRGAVGKAPVMGIRVTPVPRVDKPTLQGGIRRNVAPGTMVYLDETASCRGMREHRRESLAHSAIDYVWGQIRANGVESFWALLKRGYRGSYHKMSVKRLSRYVDEFRRRWNNRDMYAIEFVRNTVEGNIGRRLTHSTLVGGDAT